MRFKVRMIASLCVVILLSVFTGQSLGQTPEDVDVKWLTYTDQRFDYTIEYPADWVINPRSDKPGRAEVLTFQAPATNQDSDQNYTYKIQIGHYLYEIEPEFALSDWKDKELLAKREFSSRQFGISNRENILVDSSKEAIRIYGESPLGEYQYINVKSGEIVWFIWSNIGEAADREYLQIFDHMTQTIKFGEKAPLNLTEIYGEKFQPNNFDTPLSASDSKNNGVPHVLAKPLWGLDSSWNSPVAANYTVRCGSSAHTDGALYAADVATPTGTYIINSKTGVIEIRGWDNNGYGWLWKINSSGKRHYYGHLSYIYTWQGSVGDTILVGYALGQSGNSGTSSGPHLHFHVQDGQTQSSATPVDLDGMNRFYPNSYWPTTSSVVCGSMG